MLRKSHPTDREFSSISPGISDPPITASTLYPGEGTVKDADGARVDGLLHADENNRVLELELLKWNEAPIIGIDWGSFALRWNVGYVTEHLPLQMRNPSRAVYLSRIDVSTCSWPRLRIADDSA
jgi:hypothetical protein